MSMKQKNIRLSRLITLALMACLLCTCTDEEPDGNLSTTSEGEVHKVAVILPLTANKTVRRHYEQTAQWFLEKFHKAQHVSEKPIHIELEWYDEDTANLRKVAEELVVRPDIDAIIGPEKSVNVDVVARACAITYKPLLVPLASSEEVVRKYSNVKDANGNRHSFLWSLTETDISQTEVLLSLVAISGKKSVALLTPDDVYGKTFIEWTPFLANEYKLDFRKQWTYSDDAGFEAALYDMLSTDVGYVICVCENTERTRAILTAHAQAGEKAPRLLFTDSSLTPDLLTWGSIAEGAEGVSMYANPSSGFQISYETTFGVSPMSGEAQFYDALSLAALAAYYCHNFDMDDINEAIRLLTTPKNEGCSKWEVVTQGGMESSLAMMETVVESSELRGASSGLKFDAESLTTVLHSTYVHWMMYEGKFILVDYASSEDSKRAENTLATWKWKAQNVEDLEDIDVAERYAPHHDSWAVLVAGSDTWRNYRHQSDVLHFYQLLKQRGWDDEHIILVMRDDLAYNERNNYPGAIYAEMGGVNLYQEVANDYRTDTLTAADISLILQGKQSAHLPIVLHTDNHSNILVYWSGHGKEGQFNWLDRDEGFTTKMMAETLQQMHAEGRYRKILICTEPCYSSSVVKATQGIPGVLAIASSSEKESSFADIYSSVQGTWLSDRFSNNLIRSLSDNPTLTYRELYDYLVSHTLGSHVKIYNASRFGNMFKENPSEFIMAGSPCPYLLTKMDDNL